MADMRPTQPPLDQPVWTFRCDHLQGKSHSQRYRGGNWFPIYQHGLITPSGYHLNQNYHEPPAQRFLHNIMDNRSLYQHGMDSGDEACPLNDYFAESFSLVGPGMQNVRSQTTAQSVSLANCGRDVGPSHPPYSNKAVPGNEHMLFPDHPAANAYTRDLAGSLNQQQFQYPSYNPNSLCNPNAHFEFHHELPSSTEVYSNMSVFAEPYEYSHIGPATLNSNFTSPATSSIASERIASMTLESIPSQGRAPVMNFQSDRHEPTTIQGQSWAGSCISPKMLRINPSPTPMPSSESIQSGIMATGGDSDFGSASWDQQHVRATLPAKRSNHKCRKELPTKPNRPRLAPASPRESVSSRGKGRDNTHKHSHRPALHRLPHPAPVRSAHKNHLEANAGGYVESMPSSSADPEREAKNRFLVESKLAGMTYREIRRQGNFTEAESTLRGRFRTLTKNKEQRVRKPEWHDKDIRLLKKAVQKLSKGDSAQGKVPWKQVAAYIYEHDGSYHFGNATCRKKWDELVEQGATGPV